MFPRFIGARAVAALLAVALTICGGACSGGRAGGTTGANGAAAVRLQGAGATFPAPLYAKWASEYGKLDPTAQIDYQSIGSGGGIQQIQAQTVDFGASDAPMSDEDLQKAPGEILHVPTVLGAVVVTYNLAGVAQPLRFAPDVLADIFLGRVKKWNDARLKADNAGVNLPDADISVVHRSDGSGTTAVFTDYLAKVSPAWREKPGAGKAIDWPVGIGGKGNEGVTGQIKQTPNTIGYVELVYAVQNNLPVALIKNRAGNFVAPTLDAVTAAAAESVAQTPADLRVSITDATGAQAYPIASYTYILIYKEQRDAAKGRALVNFLWWGIHDGANFARELQYAPLPAQIARQAEAKLNAITAGGRTVH
ncbi:MAG TPA: phosphate ABC transporter substrate-binding protein PstS [Pyrinomonadaceae bacterium]|jgi:phosphate transport system substrate-binding protein